MRFGQTPVNGLGEVESCKIRENVATDNDGRRTKANHTSSSLYPGNKTYLCPWYLDLHKHNIHISVYLFRMSALYLYMLVRIFRTMTLIHVGDTLPQNA